MNKLMMIEQISGRIKFFSFMCERHTQHFTPKLCLVLANIYFVVFFIFNFHHLLSGEFFYMEVFYMCWYSLKCAEKGSI